ncbi:hypothetical protein PTTG_26482 [Puccinia triticina 1-1 BBBD Race 1]|uniref:Uncharacterized protein n=1 Tax=Puccinia triticina (isolate 1-1 / race 1 (BBBD)) TaxID=630390 RepID=A0A180GUB6_PUCT1|nr:hypothetical protein PTTG_26482 [Puccinia triticina 1-1 BBBD Race 1]WAR58883.1 hypothetical protein PtB15_10B222 [Puccinia triticina]
MKAFFLFAICLQSLEAREVWSNDPSFPAHRLQRRRFSQESVPAHLFNIKNCPGQVCGNLGGGSITPLLALKPPCDQQDYADKVIDAALDKTNGITDQSVRDQLIKVAKLYRVAERNTKPLYYPLQVGRYSLYCDKAPKHKELDGLVQKQDPTANGTIFFDPSKKDINDGTVLLGSQANTFPFGKVPKDFKPGNPPSGSAAGGSTQQSTDQTKPDDVTTDSSKPGDQQHTVASNGDQTDQTKTGGSGSGSTDPPKENSLDGGNQNSTLQNSQDPKNQNPNEVKTTEPDNENGGTCGGDDENKEQSTTLSTEDQQKQQSVDSNGNTDTKTQDPTVSASTTATQTGQDQNTVKSDGPQTTGSSGGDDLTADPNLSSTSTQSTSSTDPSNTGNQEQSVNPNGKTETNTGGPTVNSSTEGGGQNTVASSGDQTTVGSGTNDAKPNDITTTSTDPTSIGGSKTGDQQQQSTDSNGKTASSGCEGGDDDDDLKTESTESSQQNGKTDPLIDSNGSTTNSTEAKPTENSGSTGTPPTTAKIIASSPDLQAALDKVLAQKIDLSSLKKEECKDFRIEFGSGFKGRQATDLAYEPLQPIFPHPPALNMAIITQFMCDSLHNICGVQQSSAEESLFKDCKTLSDGLGKVVKDGSKADLWNSVFHYTTTYATEKATGPGTGGKGDGKRSLSGSKAGDQANQQQSTDTTKDKSDPPSTASADGNGNITTASTDTKPTENSSSGGSNKDAGTPPTNTGATANDEQFQKDLVKIIPNRIDLSILENKKCTDFRIEFGSAFKGREAGDLAYQPFQSFWGHGAALNMKIISHAMCDGLHNLCGVQQGSAQDSLFKDCMALSDGMGKVVKDGSKADFWNWAFFYETSYGTQKANGAGTGGKGDGQMHKPEGSTATTNSASTASTTTANANPQVQSTDPSNQNGSSGNTDPNMNMNMNQNQTQNNQNMNQDMQNMNQGMQNMNQGMQNMNQ